MTVPQLLEHRIDTLFEQLPRFRVYTLAASISWCVV